MTVYWKRLWAGRSCPIQAPPILVTGLSTTGKRGKYQVRELAIPRISPAHYFCLLGANIKICLLLLRSSSTPTDFSGLFKSDDVEQLSSLTGHLPLLPDLRTTQPDQLSNLCPFTDRPDWTTSFGFLIDRYCCRLNRSEFLSASIVRPTGIFSPQRLLNLLASKSISNRSYPSEA